MERYTRHWHLTFSLNPLCSTVPYLCFKISFPSCCVSVFQSGVLKQRCVKRMSQLTVYSLLINFSDFRIRIRFASGSNWGCVFGSGKAKMTHNTKKRWRNFMFLSAECSFLGAGFFSCSFKGLHRNLDKCVAVFFLSKLLNCFQTEIL